jgi:acyl-CoA thioester hydrolase
LTDSPFTAETTFHIRYAETDAQGIVHHSSYIVYFEEGRSEYIRQRGSSYADFERSGFFLAVTEVHARYIKAARYDDEITVRCWVSKARSRSVIFEYEIVHTESGDTLLTGRTHHICLDKAGNIRRIPEDWQQWVD